MGKLIRSSTASKNRCTPRSNYSFQLYGCRVPASISALVSARLISVATLSFSVTLPAPLKIPPYDRSDEWCPHRVVCLLSLSESVADRTTAQRALKVLKGEIFLWHERDIAATAIVASAPFKTPTPAQVYAGALLSLSVKSERFLLLGYEYFLWN